MKQGEDCLKIRTPETLNAISTLLREKVIDPKDHEALQEGYLFMRELEMNLRIVEKRPIHALPHSPEELDKLARRLGLYDEGGRSGGETLMFKYNKPAVQVREIYNKILAGVLEQPDRPAGEGT